MNNVQAARRVVILFLIHLIFSTSLSAKTWKIMPVGNSITAGKIGQPDLTSVLIPQDPGFRKKLYDKLVTEHALDVEFVGDFGETPYRGHFRSGADIRHFLMPSDTLYINNALARHKPNVVLIHLGTNDIDGDWTLDDLHQLVTTIADDPDVEFVLVCKILPRLVKDDYPDVKEYKSVYAFNSKIEEYFFSSWYPAYQNKVVIVDMNSTLYANYDPDYGLPDGTHPSANGYTRIADDYKNILVPAINLIDTSSPSQMQLHAFNSETDITLEWPRPVDYDGVANLYELRYQVNNPITESNFSEGTLYTIDRVGRNRKSSNDDTETVTLNEGFSDGQIIYFGLRVYDQANNCSDLATIAVSLETGPAQLLAVAPDFPSTVVKNLTGDSLFARVVDKNGEGVPNIRVEFELDNSSVPAQLNPLSSVTNADGLAFAQIWPDSIAGELLVRVRTDEPSLDSQLESSYPAIPVLPGAPSVFAAIHPDDIVKTGDPGQVLTPFEVYLEDQYGNAIANEPVTFEVAAGDGLFDGVTITQQHTDEFGEAQAALTLGNESETFVQVYPTNHSTLDTVHFKGITDEKFHIDRIVRHNTPEYVGAHPIETPLSTPLQVLVTNKANEPLESKSITFRIKSGSGKLDGNNQTTESITDASGIASVEWTLGSKVGQDTVFIDELFNGAPVFFIATIEPGEPDKIVEIENGVQDIVIGKGNTSPLPLRVQIVDRAGNGIENHRIKFKESNGYGGSFTGTVRWPETNPPAESIVLTDQSGFAQVYYTAGGLDNSIYYITAESLDELNATDKDVLFTLQIGPSEPSSISIISGNHQSGSVLTRLPNALCVKINDPFGAPAQNVTVSFTPDNGAAVDPALVQTNSSGEAKTYMTLGISAIEYTIEVELADFPGVEGVAFTVIGTPGPAEKLWAVNPENQQFKQVAGGETELHVRVTDQAGTVYNPVRDYQVEFQVVAGNYLKTAVGNSKSAWTQSDENGIASATYIMSSSASQANIIRAILRSKDGHVLLDSLSFRGTILPEGPAGLVLSPINKTAPVRQLYPDSLIAFVLDKNSNPVPDATVRFEVTQGGHIDNETSLTIQTRDNGQVGVQYTMGTKAGVNSDRISVTIPGYDSIPASEFLLTATAGPAFALNYVHDLDSLWSGEPQTLMRQVNVADEDNNPISNHTVQFSLETGEGTFTNGSRNIDAKTDGNGTASVHFVLDTRPGTAILYASAEELDSPLKHSPLRFKLTTIPGAPQHIELVNPSASPSNATAGYEMQLVVRVKDTWNNVVEPTVVQFNVISGAGYFDSQVGHKSAQIQSNSAGLATVVFTPALGGNSIHITAGDNSSAQKVVTILGTAATAQRIEIVQPSALDISATVADSIPIKVYAYDRDNKIVDGHTISFTATQGRLSTGYSFASKSTKDGYVQEMWFAGDKAGAAKLFIDGNIDGIPPDTISADITAGPPFADSSSIYIADPVSAGEEVVVAVMLADLYGNPVQGRHVLLQSTGTITQPQEPTDANGQTTGKIRSTIAGALLISATLKNDVSFKIEQEITIHPGPAVHLVFNPDGAPQNFTGNIGAILYEPLSVQVTDVFGNAVGTKDAQVKFSKNDEGSFEGDNASPNTAFSWTDSSGCASVQLIMPNEVKTVSVKATLSEPDKPDVSLMFTGSSRQPQEPYYLFYITGDSQNVRIGNETRPLVVRLLDRDGLPVYSFSEKLVQYSSDQPNDTFPAGSTAFSDKYGHAQLSIRIGNPTGKHTISATHPGSSSISFAVNATAGQPDKILPLTNTHGLTGTVAQKTSPVRVLVQDSLGNPVDGIPIKFRLVERPDPASSVRFEPAESITGSSDEESGIASTVVTLGEKAGTYKIQVWSRDIAEEIVEFEIVATADIASKIVKVSGDGQTGTVGKALVLPVISKVTDNYGNPVPGYELYYFTAQGHGSVVQHPNVTDSLGFANNNWIIGQIGTNILQIVNYQLYPPENRQFSATGVANNFPEFFTTTRDTTIYFGETFTKHLKALDADDDPLSYQIISPLPSGALFNGNTATLSWTPTQQQMGTWAFRYRVEDNKPAFERGYDLDSIKVNVISKMSFATIEPTEYFTSIPFESEQQFCIAVLGSNGPVTYRWYIDDQLLPGVSTSCFTLRASHYANGSVHKIKVTVRDQYGEIAYTWGVRTSVELTSFSGFSTPFKGIELEWETAEKAQDLGFDVLRCLSESGAYKKMNSAPISSQTGFYTFTDTTALAGQTYFYKLGNVSKSGEDFQSEAIKVTVDRPKDFMLKQNYPNPFNPTTNLRFQLPKAADTRIVIFNINGQVVKTVVDRRLNAGFYEIQWRGQNNSGLKVGSGVYYVRMQAGDFTATKKMLLIR